MTRLAAKFTKPQIELLENLARLHTDSGLVGAPPEGRVRLAAYNRRKVQALVKKRCVAYSISHDGEWFALTKYAFDIATAWMNREADTSSRFKFAIGSGMVTVRHHKPLDLEKYISFDPFLGKRSPDPDYKEVRIVKIRIKHTCKSPIGKDHQIQVGRKARYENTVAGREWFDHWTCLPCIDIYLKQERHDQDIRGVQPPIPSRD